MGKKKTQLAKAALPSASMSMSELQADIDLLIRVLLYDLHNVANDREAQARTQETTDELYISGPYFTSEEAARIKCTVVPVLTLNEIPEFEELEGDLKHDTTPALEDDAPKNMTVETAIKCCFQSFFEKRKASGDARPCGPHDMGPIYRAVFMISKEELKDERFLGRLRRGGLSGPKFDTTGGAVGNKKKNAGKKMTEFMVNIGMKGYLIVVPGFEHWVE
ncbi:hypothetical protein BCON_0070g00230 [Botryotinia convoluta]|uniref:Uncharacterized protein n=1 Tax=Botryotinia convoluta TaxID=54673 RepID=A0A4Z1I5Z0_9HELO|nr:hypothetical protein BCON_0070g00230 [Botryotinia convoluta]